MCWCDRTEEDGGTGTSPPSPSVCVSAEHKRANAPKSSATVIDVECNSGKIPCLRAPLRSWLRAPNVSQLINLTPNKRLLSFVGENKAARGDAERVGEAVDLQVSLLPG